ncbi:MAG: PilZ domain-containing protein [Sphingomonadales bacterium]
MTKKKANGEDQARFKTRGHPRCELRLDTQLELDDGRQVRFRTSNISQSGFSGHTIETAPIGSEVELHLPKVGPVTGEVVWQVGTAVGARLASTLSVQEIMSLALDTLKAHQEKEGGGSGRPPKT